MRPRRTATVPNMIWGTAIASIVPGQLIGSATESGPTVGAGHVGSAGHSGHTGYGGSFIVLTAAAFGGKSQ